MINAPTKPPWFVPRKERLPERKRMTIAAGFRCREGLVLCADTQETIQGYVKTDTDKISISQIGLNTYAFAGAGNSVQLDGLVQEIEARLTSKTPHALGPVKKLIRETLEEFFPHPHYPKPYPETQLLIAVQQSTGPALYVTSDRAISEVRNSESIGSGIALSKSLAAQYYRFDLSLQELSVIAGYILYYAKKWVDGCGGRSDIFLSNRSRGFTPIPQQAVSLLESYFDRLDAALSPILMASPCQPKNDALFRKLLKQLSKDLWVQRAKFRDAKA